MRTILTVILVSIVPFLNGFVLLSGPKEARLDVSPNNPVAEFVLADDLPKLSGKNSFMGGRYAELDNQAFWAALVTETMAVWNAVPDSYLELVISTAASAAADSDDRVHSIVAGSTSASASAFARPEIDGDKIVDCDITIGKSTSNASSVAYTILHELGHCIGLGHNHSNYDAVMGYSRTSKKLRLGLDDKVGLVYLYPNEDIGSAKETLGCAVLGREHSSLPAVLLVFLPFFVFAVRRRHIY